MIGYWSTVRLDMANDRDRMVRLDNWRIIPQVEHDAKSHVKDSHHDGRLHLERVEVDDLVLSKLPHGIHAERVRRLRIVAAARRSIIASRIPFGIHSQRFVLRYVCIVVIDQPRRSEQVDRLGEQQSNHRFRIGKHLFFSLYGSCFKWIFFLITT